MQKIFERNGLTLRKPSGKSPQQLSYNWEEFKVNFSKNILELVVTKRI